MWVLDLDLTSIWCHLYPHMQIGEWTCCLWLQNPYNQWAFMIHSLWVRDKGNIIIGVIGVIIMQVLIWWCGSSGLSLLWIAALLYLKRCCAVSDDLNLPLPRNNAICSRFSVVLSWGTVDSPSGAVLSLSECWTGYSWLSSLSHCFLGL